MNQRPKITRFILATLLVTTPYTTSTQPKTVQQAHPTTITSSASQQQSLPFFSRWYQQASSWTAKALIIGAIGFGIYYLANKQMAKKKTIKLNLTGKPANFDHAGPICYRNALFQVLCHADGIAPAIFAELQKSPRKAKSTQEFYNLMTSKEKIKDWEKNYPHLHQMLFTAVGEKPGQPHSGQDPALTIASYFGLNSPGIKPNLTPEEEEFASILIAPLAYTRVKKETQNEQKMSWFTSGGEGTSALALQRARLKSFPITTLPQCLYVYAGGTCKASKTVDLAPICAPEAKAQPQELYDLVGVVCNIPGHYISYIRRNNIWYRCDDFFGGSDKIKQIDNPFDATGTWNHKKNGLDERPHMLFYAKQETV